MSPLIRRVVEAEFPFEIRPEVVAVLEARVGAGLPAAPGSRPEDFDAVRLAVIKLACGNFVRLLAAAADANTGWRDTVAAAGDTRGLASR